MESIDRLLLQDFTAVVASLSTSVIVSASWKQASQVRTGFCCGTGACSNVLFHVRLIVCYCTPR
jgi:hypothetical protein